MPALLESLSNTFVANVRPSWLKARADAFKSDSTAQVPVFSGILRISARRDVLPKSQSAKPHEPAFPEPTAANLIPSRLKASLNGLIEAPSGTSRRLIAPITRLKVPQDAHLASQS